MNDTYTYIETDTLNLWGAQITKLNNDSLDIISSIEKEVKSLNEYYWQGNAASGFTQVMNDLIDDAKIYHNKMKDIEKMLKEIIITAENQ